MKKYLAPGSIGCIFFLIGVVLSPASATSHRSTWLAIFGNSTSCGLGAASINDETDKAGTVTENRRGCDHDAKYRSVPPYYIGARVLAVQTSFDYVCGDSGLEWNTTTDESITQTVAIAPGTFCGHPGRFRGESTNYRDTDNDGLKRLRINSPTRPF